MIELEYIPVLYPTEEEFNDPILYLSQSNIQRLGHVYGMLKLIPPKNFKPPMIINEDKFKFHVRLQKLSELNIFNRPRMFFLRQLNNFNIVLYGKTKESVLKETYYWEQNYQVYYYDLFIEIIKFYTNHSTTSEDIPFGRKRTRSNHSKEMRHLVMAPSDQVLNNTALWKSISKILSIPSNVLIKVYTSILLPYYDFLQKKSEKYNGTPFISQLLYNEEFPISLLNDVDVHDSDTHDELYSSDDASADEGCSICHRDTFSRKLIICDSCEQYFHLFCLSPPLQSVPTGNWVCDNCIIGNGYYGFKEDKILYSKSQFQQACHDFDSKFFSNKQLENIRGLEDKFWGIVNDIDSDLIVKYGADIHNDSLGEITAFPTMDWIPPNIKKDSDSYKEFIRYANHPMNLLNLPKTKGSLLPMSGRKISGMTVPWIYIGSTFSTFCWHLEDQYTLSANYQHEGDPKVWYSIPEQSCDKFNNLMVDIAPDLFEKQPDLLHQLITLISPYDPKFKSAGITCYKAVQYPGEYIITYPKCYHAGFNSGYNFNEAVNFTLDLWVPYGVQAVRDYKVTKKKCVFDIWELMLNILIQYLEGPKTFNEALVRRCHLELLEIFNSEFKIITQLEGILSRKNKVRGFARNHLRQEIKNNKYRCLRQESNKEIMEENEEEDEDDLDICCTKCKTVCPFAFVVHYYVTKPSKKQKLNILTASQWNEKVLKGEFMLLCVTDYLKIIEDCQVHADSFSNASIKDELFYIRDPEEIKKILTDTEKKTDNFLR